MLRKGSKDSRIVVKNYESETTLSGIEGRNSFVFVRFLLKNCMPELWKTTLKYKNLLSLTSKILGSCMRVFTVLTFSLCFDFFFFFQRLMCRYRYKSVVTFGGWKDDFMLVVNQSIMRGGATVEQGTQRLLFVMSREKVTVCKISQLIKCSQLSSV